MSNYKKFRRKCLKTRNSRDTIPLSIKKSKTLDVSKARSFLYSFYFRVSHGGSVSLKRTIFAKWHTNRTCVSNWNTYFLTSELSYFLLLFLFILRRGLSNSFIDRLVITRVTCSLLFFFSITRLLQEKNKENSSYYDLFEDETKCTVSRT